jgi:hypothetical protein
MFLMDFSPNHFTGFCLYTSWLHFQISLSFFFCCRTLFYNCGNWLILTGSFLRLNQIFGRKWDGKVQTHQQILGVWSKAICFILRKSCGGLNMDRVLFSYRLKTQNTVWPLRIHWIMKNTVFCTLVFQINVSSNLGTLSAVNSTCFSDYEGAHMNYLTMVCRGGGFISLENLIFFAQKYPVSFFCLCIDILRNVLNNQVVCF